MKIAHLSDIHIENLKRHDEYHTIFAENNKYLKPLKLDVIVVVGDLFENFIEVSNEADILAGEFLTDLSKICKYLIIEDGNHDIRKKDISRASSIKSVVKLLNIKNILYHDKSTTFTLNGFEDFIFANYSHLQKNIKPIISEDDKNKTVIGLYHDPIRNCKTLHKTFTDNKIPDINYFDGCDYLLMGDIHLRQFFNNERFAYPSSLIQQDHGEDIYNHGGLIWDIKDKNTFEVRPYNIKNDYAFINIDLKPIVEDIDYDNLVLDNDDIKNFLYPIVKVKWTDLKTNINDINKNKIKNNLLTKYSNLTEENIIFDEDKIKKLYNSSNNEISINMDVNDKANFNNIITKYLKENGFNDLEVIEILKLDDAIESKLDADVLKGLNQYNIKLVSFGCNNFKSSGDDVVFVVDNTKGIIQITGENRVGKSTILDILSYAKFGTTYFTNTVSGAKKIKHNDKQYINNKRNIDSADAFVCLNINGVVYTIVRKTTIERNRKNDITGVKTIVSYSDGFEADTNSDLQAERDKKTQKIIEESLGDFKSYMRNNIITGDNLNDLLTIDRPTFIDSVAADLGFEILDCKYKAIGKYEENYNKTNTILKLNQFEEEAKIKTIEDEIILLQNNIIEKTNENTTLKSQLDDLNNSKDKLLKDIIVVDNSLKTLDVNDLQAKINNNSSEIEKIKEEIETLKKQINFKLPNFNEQQLNDTNTSFDTLTSNLSVKNNLIIKNNKKVSELKIKLTSDKNKNDNLKTDYINKWNLLCQEKNNAIGQLEVNKNIDIDKLKNDLKNTIVKAENEISLLKKDYEVAVDKYKNFKKEVDDLKKSDSCPFCKTKYDVNNAEHVIHLEENKKAVEIKEVQLNVIVEDGKKIKNNLTSKEQYLTSKKFDLENITNDLEYQKIVDKYKLEINSIEEDINKIKHYINNPNDSKKLKKEGFKIKTHIIFKSRIKYLLNRSIKNIEKEVVDITNESNILKIKIVELNDLKNKHIDYIKNELEISRKEKNVVDLETANKNYNDKISEYNKSLKDIEANELIESQITVKNTEITEINENMNKVLVDKTNIENYINSKKLEITEINNNISIYLKQQKEIKIIKAYKDTFHRDGLAVYLIKQCSDLINDELDDLLKDLDFNIYLNDDLVLMMNLKNSDKNTEQIALTCSGAERSFTALAFKIALRNVNFKSRFNFIGIDEVTGKMVNDNIKKFSDLLKRIKEKIDIIFIIEHNHNVDEDYIINVKKDKNKVSIFETNF